MNRLSQPDPEEAAAHSPALSRRGSPAESEQVLKQHPELLTDQADAILTQLVESQAEPVGRRVARYREFLRRCRAAHLVEVGNAHSQLLTGDRESNLQHALMCFRAALRFYTPEETPVEYGRLY